MLEESTLAHYMIDRLGESVVYHWDRGAGSFHGSSANRVYPMLKLKLFQVTRVVLPPHLACHRLSGFYRFTSEGATGTLHQFRVVNTEEHMPRPRPNYIVTWQPKIN